MEKLEEVEIDLKYLQVYTIFVTILLAGGMFYYAYQVEKQEERADLYEDLFWETAEVCEGLVIDYNIILENWDNLNQTQKDQMLSYLRFNAEKLKNGG